MSVSSPEQFITHPLKAIDRRAITCGLSVWLTVTLAFALQIDNPWWGAMAAFRVSVRNQDVAEYMRRNRFLGTVAGCLFGLLVAGFLVDSRGLALGATFAIAVIGTYKLFTAGPAYGWFLGAITALLIINASTFGTEDLFEFAVARMVETLLAVTVVGVMDRCFLPYSPTHHYKSTPHPTAEQKREFAIVALAVGCTIVVLSLIWVALDLPQPYAVLMTTLAVYSTTVTQQKAKSFYRFGGVFIGGAAALFVAALSTQSFILWSILFLVFVISFSAYANSGRPDSYTGLQCGYAFVVGTVHGAGPIASITPIVDRLVGIVFGIAVAFVILMSIYAVLSKEPS